MYCKRCGSEKYVKAGKIAERQRYKCKNCGYHYTVNSKGKDPGIKRLALEMYLEGNSFREISRILNVSDVSVIKWIRKFGKAIEVLKRKDRKFDVVEVEDVSKYIIDKNDDKIGGWMLIGVGENEKKSCWVRCAKSIELKRIVNMIFVIFLNSI